MSSPGVTFNLTWGKGLTELQNLTNLRLSSYAESHQIQQKNLDVSPYERPPGLQQEGLAYPMLYVLVMTDPPGP